ncbi:hypothetical protein PFISCL1PPCAC_19009, partial [Pristionchus fissidentatus]
VTTTMISPNGSTSQEISTTLDSHNSTDLSEEATVGATATTTHERRPTTPLERYSSILDSYKTLQMDSSTSRVDPSTLADDGPSSVTDFSEQPSFPTTAVDDDTSEGQKETESG